MNPEAKARKRQRDRARAKEKKAAAKTLASQEASPVTTKPAARAGNSSKLFSDSTPLAVSTSNNTPYSKVLNKKFLTPQDGEVFEKLIHDHYQNFVHIPADQMTPSSFHGTAKAVLERLRDANYYQYDVVMAGGKHSSRTFVKRTLVGDPGITYKYLNLRLFAHAWSGPGCLPVMKSIGDLNHHMIRMTKQHANHAKCNYNLTLINYMEPTSHTKVGFKDEAYYGMGKVSVSWHADSSLENNSSIGVYHCLPTQRAAKWDWRLALRRSPESGADAKDVLPVSVSTKDGDAYFLLGTFNETHQHCVLAGSEANRISSTHRVAVTEEDTYQYILKRVKGALKRFRTQLEGQSPSKLDATVIVHCQRVLTEVEMEWIAQYWLQGAEHDKMHTWWQRPMKTLEAFWSSLEDLTFRLYQTCVKESTVVPRAVIEGLLTELTARQKHRQQWDGRRADKIYQRRISAPFRPVAKPLFEEDKELGKDLTEAIGDLTRILVKNGPAPTEDVDRKKKKGKNAKRVESKPTIKANEKSNEEQSESQCKEKQVARSQTMDSERAEASEASDRQRKRSIEKAPGEGRKKNKKRRKSKPVKLV